MNSSTLHRRLPFTACALAALLVERAAQPRFVAAAPADSGRGGKRLHRLGRIVDDLRSRRS